MASPSEMVATSMLLLILLGGDRAGLAEGEWCVARSDASYQALKTALDYACASGADCSPIQPSGLCYLPNTLQSHASYAINSYYERRGSAPGSCDFSGTATLATTDPSYGSCVYPSSQRTAGGTNSTTSLRAPPPPDISTIAFDGNGSNSRGCAESSIALFLINVSCFLLLSLMCQLVYVGP
ncbi:hypothetical protein NMG60_11031780 [Bertholletia excelsa]